CALGLLVALGISLIVVFRTPANSPDASPTSSRGPALGTHGGIRLSFRPVLCYAPPYVPAATQRSTSGLLPTCGARYELTATNLNATPDSGDVAGYLSSTVPPDPRFASYPSATSQRDNVRGTVLLPGGPGTGSDRFVVGPAGLTQTAVQSADVERQYGQWVVNLNLTSRGSTKWDNLAERQFHAIIGIDLNGRIISAPIVQPTQSSFASFGGTIQIAGGFTGQQAKALAAKL
ncbi:MAG TPA: hypothetical protein VEJ87_00140, partial [Acidimicrobiales bacterium]|nr:hypothetical protein [Acidimicrobiales bacterium]